MSFFDPLINNMHGNKKNTHFIQQKPVTSRNSTTLSILNSLVILGWIFMDLVLLHWDFLISNLIVYSGSRQGRLLPRRRPPARWQRRPSSHPSRSADDPILTSAAHSNDPSLTSTPLPPIGIYLPMLWFPTFHP